MRKGSSNSSEDTFFPDRVNDPWGSYPEPEISIVESLKKRLVIVISFFVRVPVLSEQMIVTDPRLSAAGSRLMIMFFLARILVPNESPIVTMAGKDRGTAATAKLNEKRKSSPN